LVDVADNQQSGLVGTFVAFKTPFVARHDKCSENTATKAKRAERHDDDELQQLTHRNSSGSFAILTAIRRASSRERSDYTSKKERDRPPEAGPLPMRATLTGAPPRETLQKCRWVCLL
jgi:hypothetical protein